MRPTSYIDNYSLSLLSGVDNNENRDPSDMFLAPDGKYILEFFIMALVVNLTKSTNEAEVREILKMFLEDVVSGLSTTENPYIKIFAHRALNGETLQDLANEEQQKYIDKGKVHREKALFSQLDYIYQNRSHVKEALPYVIRAWGLMDMYEAAGLSGFWSGFKGLFVGKDKDGSGKIDNYNEASGIGKMLRSFAGKGAYSEAHGKSRFADFLDGSNKAGSYKVNTGKSRTGDFFRSIFGNKTTRELAKDRKTFYKTGEHFHPVQPIKKIGIVKPDNVKDNTTGDDERSNDQRGKDSSVWGDFLTDFAGNVLAANNKSGVDNQAAKQDAGGGDTERKTQKQTDKGVGQNDKGDKDANQEARQDYERQLSDLINDISNNKITQQGLSEVKRRLGLNDSATSNDVVMAAQDEHKKLFGDNKGIESNIGKTALFTGLALGTLFILAKSFSGNKAARNEASYVRRESPVPSRQRRNKKPLGYIDFID